MNELATTEVVTRAEYLIFIFTASVGVLQLVAARTQLKGLLFFRKSVLAYPLSLLLIIGSFWWFFVRDDRIDTIMRQTGLEGSGQFYNFCMGAFAALLFTLAASSLIGLLRHRRQRNENENSEGLNTLRQMSYYEAVKRSFRSKED
ncbi:MAG: hypothetical protein ISS53_00855 [Dehalococcoidia bacterium]|nr:hypothetical protein [Dehalococcoidia bacterium]